jgi:hypothetical protein
MSGSRYGPLGSADELARFNELKARLPAISHARRSDPGWEHTSVVVPSVSVNREELEKIEGAAFYEERLLFTLIRLADPAARAVYVTSQPIHSETLEYYLQHLPGVPLSRVRNRLLMLCLYDATPRSLTEKILDRPRVIERIKAWVGPPERAYLTVYNSTPLERRLAVELGIPLNSVDPELLWMGTKSGSRKVFAEAGVDRALGTNDVTTRDEVVEALDRLASERPGLKRAVVKLNESFAGEGNGVFRFPDPLEDGPRRRAALLEQLDRLEWPSSLESSEGFFRKLGEMGGVVEEWIEDEEVLSPSVQLRIYPDGELSVISTHDQVLGGSTGQVYIGCRFPARQDYRELILADARRIGGVLARNGVVGRFGVDFLVTRSAGGPWKSYAVEINLRMGGTTPPFMALEFLARGKTNEESGVYVAADGQPKYYFATDNLKSPAYRGLLPEDLFDLTVAHGIHFDYTTLQGVIFFMIGALSQYGKLGVISIGNSREEADRLYETTVAILDRETGATLDGVEVPRSLFGPSLLSME